MTKYSATIRKNIKYEPHELLIDNYLSSGQLPYKSNFKNPKIEICREFEIIFPGGLCRYDVMFINHSDERYDILEFKSRPLLLKDAYQIYRYMKAFLYNANNNKSINYGYKYCFHLIGKPYEDERLDNLILMQSPVFNICVYYDSENRLEVFNQDCFNVESIWK